MGHNYTKYSKNLENRDKRKQHNPIDEAAPVEVTEEIVTEPEKIMGVVTECVKLNVRAAADTNADILCEILLGSEVVIDETESTDDFYKVCTETGVEGFCMKRYINTN